MGDNKELEVKAQTRKQGGNGTIQQMATESRSEQRKKKTKNVRNGSLVYTYTRTYVKVEIFRFKCMRNPPAKMFKLRDSYSMIN